VTASRSAALAADGSVDVAESGEAGPTCLDKQTVARFDAGKVRRVATGLLSTGGEDGCRRRRRRRRRLGRRLRPAGGGAGAHDAQGRPAAAHGAAAR
jgi:hypothetical protein